MCKWQAKSRGSVGIAFLEGALFVARVGVVRLVVIHPELRGAFVENAMVF